MPLELFDRTYDPYGVGAVLGRLLQTLNPYGVRDQLMKRQYLHKANVQTPARQRRWWDYRQSIEGPLGVFQQPARAAAPGFRGFK